MADIIQLRPRGGNRKERQALRQWARRLGYDLDPAVCIAGLPDTLLLALAEGDAEGSALLDELIVAVRTGFPRDVRSLPSRTRLQVLDLALFMIDQLRFECMTRLGWIDPLPAREIALIHLIQSDATTLRRLRTTPLLREDHPHHHSFRGFLDMEKETFLRRQIPAALEQFRRRAKETH
jgi:hypothetical protein